MEPFVYACRLLPRWMMLLRLDGNDVAGKDV